jgi:hypothetical protein
MKTPIINVAFSAALFVALSLHAQANFQDLNFESANLSNPSGPLLNEVPIANALPGWSASIGGVALTQVWANSDSGGEATIDVLGRNWNSINPGILDGNYSVYLQAFDGGQGNVSIWQNGTIPANSLSLQFKAWDFDANGAFSVSFAGNSLSPVVIGSGQSPSGQSYEVYGANIAAYAGQTGTLEFNALVTGLGESATEFDDITFSNVAVMPEPNTLALIVMGGLALAARRWRRKPS